MQLHTENGHNPPRSDDTTPFTPDIVAYIERLAEKFHLPSISIGIVRKGETFVQCFGDAHLSTTKATPDSLYYLASVTKSFTATTLLSVLKDLESGTLTIPKDLAIADLDEKITLKTKIKSILPTDFALADETATAHATLEDALGHRLGVGANDYGYGGTPGYTVRDAVRSLRYLPMAAELRERHEYLNMGYMTIQHVIETLTGKPIEASHHAYIWDPLGMASTFPSLQAAQQSGKDLCSGYAYDPLAKTLQRVTYVNDYPLIGGGGLISSIRDLTAYLRGVIHGDLPLGKERQEKLLTPLSIRLYSPPQKHWSHSCYCLGWTQATYRGQSVVSHKGGINGFGSQLLYLPNQQWGIAILSNGQHVHSAIKPLLQRLIDDVLAIPASDREPSPEDDLSNELEHSADEIAKARTTIYPRIPDPPLPSTLPIASYAGTYASPSHQSITLVVAPPLPDSPVKGGTREVLHTETTRLVHFTLDLEHVSGDFFLAWADLVPPAAAFRRGLRAQFVMRADGEVEKLGINFEPETTEGDDLKMTWFKKIK